MTGDLNERRRHCSTRQDLVKSAIKYEYTVAHLSWDCTSCAEGSDNDVRALKTELKKAEVDLKRSKTKDYYKILGEWSIAFA